MGRPPKFNSPEELEALINAYFNQFEVDKFKMPTKAGLALFLDTTRETLGDYEKKEEFSYAIKRAYTIIEDAWVQSLRGQSVAGIIFYLKNAFSKDYRDKHETDITSGGDKLEPIQVRIINEKQGDSDTC